MATTTSTSTWTITHTATHIADVIMGSIADILGHLGIDATRLYSDWSQDESAISAWIAEKSLKAVVLECHRPGGGVRPIFEFPVTYRTAGEGNSQFTADQATLARYMAKISSVPRGTTYRLFVTFYGQHSDQPGWTTGTRASTEGLRSTSFGTLANAPHGTAGLRQYN